MSDPLRDAIRDAVEAAIAPLFLQIREMKLALEALRNQPEHEWETIKEAITLRRVSRPTLMADIKSGRVNHRSKPFPGGSLYLLSVADLDRLHPKRAIGRRGPRTNIDELEVGLISTS